MFNQWVQYNVQLLIPCVIKIVKMNLLIIPSGASSQGLSSVFLVHCEVIVILYIVLLLKCLA